MKPSAEVRALNASWSKTDHEKLGSTFGVKTLGLSRLPEAWVPPSLAISVGFCQIIRSDPAMLRGELTRLFPEIQKWQSANETGDHLILRSSATSETILDRGKFQTEELDRADLDALEQAIIRICSHFISSGHPGEMALLLQPFLPRRAWGHAANIRRVSKTRNHWEYEVEGTDGTIRLEIEDRFNTERVPVPSNPSPLVAATNERLLRTALQLAGRWISETIDPVVSVEWILSGDTVWLVQCDDEIAHPSAIDPRVLELPPQADEPVPFPEPFRLYVVGDDTPIRKLKLLKDFSPDGFPTSHAIHYAFGSDLSNATKTADNVETLGKALTLAAPNGLVVRTACTDVDRSKSMNLPRTDTVGGTDAAKWIAKQLLQFSVDGIPADKCAFLMHRFIPARKAAWTYYNPEERRVYIDALWGLPDGIQFYPHDSYEYDVATELSDRPTVAFKPYVLWPSLSGKWEKLHVDPAHARRQCLTQEEITQIAKHAVAISKVMNEPTQIMWFCSFPKGGEHSSPLPWYREEVAMKPHAQAAAPLLPRLVVSSQADLKKILVATETPPSRLILEPGPSDIRDPEFIDLAVKCAKQGNHVVVMEGSALAHAYYQLTSSGVIVHSLRGTGRRRTLRKREFGKLVRDNIPDVIAATGETATFGPIPSSARKRLLIAKAMEELWELSRADQSTEVEEIADLYEVLSSLLTELGLSWDAVEIEAKRKRTKRGGFSQGYVLIGTGIPVPSADLFPVSDRRKNPVHWKLAMKAASDLEISGNRLTVPFFTLLDATRDTIAVIGKNDQRRVVQIELEGDRMTLEISDAPLGEVPAPRDGEG